MCKDDGTFEFMVQKIQQLEKENAALKDIIRKHEEANEKDESTPDQNTTYKAGLKWGR
jgi:hypothetical protein